MIDVDIHSSTLIAEQQERRQEPLSRLPANISLWALIWLSNVFLYVCSRRLRCLCYSVTGIDMWVNPKPFVSPRQRPELWRFLISLFPATSLFRAILVYLQRINKKEFCRIRFQEDKISGLGKTAWPVLLAIDWRLLSDRFVVYHRLLCCLSHQVMALICQWRVQLSAVTLL